MHIRRGEVIAEMCPKNVSLDPQLEVRVTQPGFALIHLLCCHAPHSTCSHETSVMEHVRKRKSWKAKPKPKPKPKPKQTQTKIQIQIQTQTKTSKCSIMV